MTTLPQPTRWYIFKRRVKAAYDVVRKAPLRDKLNFRRLWLFWRVWPFTMVDYKRLANADDLVADVDKRQLPGAIVECGVWKGGCSAVMAYRTLRNNSNRSVWLFDSFEGLPEPTEVDGDKARQQAQNNTSGELKPIGRCVGPLEEVHTVLFSVLRIPRGMVNIVKGWFQDTLPKASKEMEPIAVLRLDGDWYESTIVCLNNLYDKVVPSGYVIIDDYGYWQGCKKAVDEFLKERNITVTLQTIDGAGRYFQKP